MLRTEYLSDSAGMHQACHPIQCNAVHRRALLREAIGLASIELNLYHYGQDFIEEHTGHWIAVLRQPTCPQICLDLKKASIAVFLWPFRVSYFQGL